jgi:hypothetical protein
MLESSAKVEKDQASHWLAPLLWGLPSVAILTSGLVDLAPVVRGMIWSFALL